MKGRLSFDEDHCKGCGLCVEACPLNLLALDTTRVNKIGYTPAMIVKPNDCVACLNCALMCPDSVISIFKVEV